LDEFVALQNLLLKNPIRVIGGLSVLEETLRCRRPVSQASASGGQGFTASA
jgi:hypothetical protein